MWCILEERLDLHRQIALILVAEGILIHLLGEAILLEEADQLQTRLTEEELCRGGIHLSIQVGTTRIDRIYDTREGAARGGEGEKALTLILDGTTSLLLEELDVGPCRCLKIHIGEYKPVYSTLSHAYLSTSAALALQGDHDLPLARLAIAVGCYADIDPLGDGIGCDGDPLVITLGGPEVGTALHVDGAGLTPLGDLELTRAGTATGMSNDHLRALSLHDGELATYPGGGHHHGA